MNTSYITSITSLRCKTSVSDYTCYDRIPISPYCSCCTNDKISINPRFLYGLRQSTLIQCKPSRMITLTPQACSRFTCGIDRNWYYQKSGPYACSRFTVCDIDLNWCYQKSGPCVCSRFTVCDIDPVWCYQKSGRHACSRFTSCDIDRKRNYLEEGSSNGRRGRWRKGNYGRMVSEERGKGFNSRKVHDAELMLSLLTEEVSEECLGVRRRNGKSSRTPKMDKREGRIEKNNVGSSYKCDYQSVESKEEDNRQREEERRRRERENENLRERKEGSSCSSYYSLSSLGEIDSDSEVQVKDDTFVEESSQKRNGKIKYGREFEEEIIRDGGCNESQGIRLEKFDTTTNRVESDWRKKSEKKLTEVSIEQAESKKESSQKLFSSSEMNNKYDDQKRERKSSSALRVDDGRKEKVTEVRDDVTRQSELNMKYNQVRERERIQSSVNKASSSSEKQYRGRDDRKSGQYSTRWNEYQEKIQQGAKVSETKEKAESKKESSQKFFSSLEMNNNYDDQKRERKSSSALRIDDGRKEKVTEVRDDVTRQSELKMQYNQVRERERIQSSVNKASSSSEKQYRGRDDRESGQYSTRWNEYQEKMQQGAKVSETKETDTTHNAEEHGKFGQEVTLKMNSRKKSQHSTEISDTHDVDIESTIISQRRSNMRIKKQEESFSSYQEVKEQQSQTDAKAIKRLESRKEAHDFMTDPENITKSSYERASSEEKGQTSSPHLQLEIHGESRRDGTHVVPSSFISHEDAIASADKSQQFATHFVSEFVEKAKEEISTSELEKVTSSTKKVDEENKQMGQPGSSDYRPKDRDSRLSSRSSGAKGPSAEMWAVNNPSLASEEPPEVEATEGGTKEVVRRSGRSMWGMMSDIVRLRWGQRSETRSSRSGERSSPNQSTSTEAWFSGHEHDEYVSDTMKKEITGVPQSIDRQQETGQSQQETSIEGDSLSKGKSSSSNEESLSEHLGDNSGTEISKLTSPLPAIRLRRSPVIEEISGGTSDASGSSTLVERKEFSGSGTEHLGDNSGTEISKFTSPLPAIRMRRSPVIEKISGGTSDASGSSTLVERKETPGSTSDASGSGTMVESKIESATENKDGEVKRRKLQRNKQVPKDRFDEWEEAFTIEMEQRKTDEMFMKEALLEAKRAGDMWEVPVGAVLVHNGKIIARGYNLVEELRDSTAHAEMICIREGSNVLQSWRLSETTLYVTLEPCPMCAGAILQARVDTVVWGAPNKLLGADGSWIRLFPNGGEEGNSSEPRDRASAPVHPFHPKMKVRRGVLESECANVMQEFFQLRRRKKEKKTESATPPPSSLPISQYPSKFFTKMHHVFTAMFCL